MIDPFEEFEFKPLTEGLGFHNKKVDLPSEVRTSGFVKDEFKPTVPQKPAAMINKTEEPKRTWKTESAPEVTTPLPRRDEIIEDLVRNFKTPTDKFGKFIDEQTPTFKAPAPTKTYSSKATAKTTTPSSANRLERETAWEFSPFLIDALLVSAFSLICLIIALYVTKIDLIGSLMAPDADPLFLATIPAIVVGMGAVYAIITRTFMHGTLGELAFDLQIGSTKDQQSNLYPIKVLFRSVVIIATGFVVLPILSLIFQRDFAGQLTGTTLVRKN